MDEPPIQIFVMGINQWRSEHEWPLARTRYTPFYLHSGGGANTLDGDGSLSQEKPSAEPIDNFAYDPHNPVPTRGGALCCWEAALPAGAYDQRPIEERPDVLVYSSPPLEHDLEVTGPIRVHLWAATTAADTDFTVKLVDVGPCKGGGCTGYARNIQDSIIRARYRNPGVEALLRPGEIYEFTIDLAATSNVFKAGHQIRIEISSSNFPRFDRNPNTGAFTGNTSELRPALQTVYHDAEHPSHILLPIIPD
jgi:putative CocE/NonD family hydrolase